MHSSAHLPSLVPRNLLAIGILTLLPGGASAGEPAPVRLWGIEHQGTGCARNVRWEQAVSDQMESLGRPVERRPAERSHPGCSAEACAAVWPGAHPDTQLLGGFVEPLPNGGERARLWLYEAISQSVAYRDVYAPSGFGAGNELGRSAYALVASPGWVSAGASAPSLPRYCSPSSGALDAEPPPPRDSPACRPLPAACHAGGTAVDPAVPQGATGPTAEPSNTLVTVRKVLTFGFAGLSAVSLGLLAWQASRDGEFVPNMACANSSEMPTVLWDNRCFRDTRANMAIAGAVSGGLLIAAFAVWPWSTRRHPSPSGNKPGLTPMPSAP